MTNEKKIIEKDHVIILSLWDRYLLLLNEPLSRVIQYSHVPHTCVWLKKSSFNSWHFYRLTNKILLQSGVLALCQSYRANAYPWPKSSSFFGAVQDLSSHHYAVRHRAHEFCETQDSRSGLECCHSTPSVLIYPTYLYSLLTVL